MSTVAAYYTGASSNPFLICDNLENDSMTPQMRLFLLHVATSVQKSKMARNADTDLVRGPSSPRTPFVGQKWIFLG